MIEIVLRGYIFSTKCLMEAYHLIISHSLFSLNILLRYFPWSINLFNFLFKVVLKVSFWKGVYFLRPVYSLSSVTHFYLYVSIYITYTLVCYSTQIITMLPDIMEHSSKRCSRVKMINFGWASFLPFFRLCIAKLFCLLCSQFVGFRCCYCILTLAYNSSLIYDVVSAFSSSWNFVVLDQSLIL